MKLPGLLAPAPAALTAFASLHHYFPQLEPALQLALWPDYLAFRDAVAQGLVPGSDDISISEPASLWAHAALVHVQMGPFGNPQAAEVGFDVAWDPDHTKGIGVEDGRATYLNGSIRSWA